MALARPLPIVSHGDRPPPTTIATLPLSRSSIMTSNKIRRGTCSVVRILLHATHLTFFTQHVSRNTLYVFSNVVDTPGSSCTPRVFKAIETRLYCPTAKT